MRECKREKENGRKRKRGSSFIRRANIRSAAQPRARSLRKKKPEERKLNRRKTN